jgi:tetratricopeptide (TPR) repeat protein
VTSRWGFFKLDVQADAARPRRLQLSMHTRLAEVRVEPKDFAAFQQFHEELSKSYRVWLNLRPTSELADAPLLELTLALAPWSNPVTASTLARLYLDHGQYHDARRVLRTACIYHSQDRGLWDMRVQAAASLDEEEEIYRDMLRHFRKDAKLKIALGATRVKRGDHAGARRVLEPLTGNAVDKIRGAAHFQLARSYFEENQYPAALKHLEAAGQADPQVVADASSLHFKAQVQEKLGQQEAAIASYREVLALEHDALDTLVPLVGLELKAGQTKDALDHLRRFTLAVGNDPAGLTLAAEFHLEMNRLEDAFELAGRARAAGFVANNQRVLGLVHFRKKDFDKAIFHLERSEVDAEVLEGLIEAYLSLGDLAKAERHYETAQSLDEGKGTPGLSKIMRQVQTLVTRREQLWQDMNLPEDGKNQAWTAINHYLCADLAYQNHAARDQVARLLGGSFVDGVDLGPALALRGLVYLEKGNLKAAFADAQRALQLKPVDGRAFYVRGRVRLERDEPGAVSDLERAATLSRREDGVILHWLAAALFEAGRPEDARIVQRRALELKPVDAELADQLRAFEKTSRKAGI